MTDLIKQKTGNAFNQYDQIVFVSCRVALAGKDNSQIPKQNGSYTQTIANALDKPVYTATEFSFITPSGKLTIAGSTAETVGARKSVHQDLGRLIRFDPGGKPSNSSSLQDALKEHAIFPESKKGSGAEVDMEFDTINLRRCVNATVPQYMGK